MPVYSSDNDGLMEQLQAASEEEGQATKDLHNYMKSGGSDLAIMAQLTERFEETHRLKMDLYDQLQQYRLDG